MIRRKQPIKRSPAPRRGSRVKRSNHARRKDTFARCFHSKARVGFVQSLPCAMCRMRDCDNAHVGNKGAGVGRRADYDQIAPLCRSCHTKWHNSAGMRGIFYNQLLRAASDTEAAWQAHLERTVGRAHHAGEP